MKKLPNPKVSPCPDPGKEQSSPPAGPEHLRIGLHLRGVHKEALLELADLHDSQPGRVANRLLCEALDLASRGR